jgi:hypothetical protein
LSRGAAIYLAAGAFNILAQMRSIPIRRALKPLFTALRRRPVKRAGGIMLGSLQSHFAILLAPIPRALT